MCEGSEPEREREREKKRGCEANWGTSPSSAGWL